MREIVHIQAGQCGNQIGAKVSDTFFFLSRKIEKRREKFNEKKNQNKKNISKREIQ